MATYSVPGQNLSYSIPDDGQSFINGNSGVGYLDSVYTRQGNNVYQLSPQDYARNYLSGQGVDLNRLASATGIQLGLSPGGNTAQGYDQSLADMYHKAQSLGLNFINTANDWNSGGFANTGYYGQNSLADYGQSLIEKALGMEAGALKKLPGFNLADVNQAFTSMGGRVSSSSDINLLKSIVNAARAGETVSLTPSSQNPNAPVLTSDKAGTIFDPVAQGLSPSSSQPGAIDPTKLSSLVNPNAGFQNNVQQPQTVNGVAVPASQPAPGTPAASGAIPMGDGTPGGYVAQPSPLDLMKQQLLQAQDWLTSQGAPPQTVADKYKTAFDSLKGTDAAATQGDAMSAITEALANQGTQPSATQSFIDGYSSLNPAERHLYDTIQSALSTMGTQQSLSQMYAAAMGNVNLPAGIPGESLSQEQLQAMNIKNLMKGTEDDIRTEIQKAGGFATESQVQGLTAARNKVLQNQLNTVLQSEQLKQDYIDNLMNFTQLDRKSVEDQLNQKLKLEEAQVELLDNAKNAAKDNWQNTLKAIGFDGLMTMVKGNPVAEQQAESALGLPSGSLQNEALMAQLTKSDAKLQFISGTANQRAGVFNPQTGTFTPVAGGGGGIGSGGGGASGPNASLLNQVTNTLRTSLSNPTKAQLAVIDSIASSANPLPAIQNQAKNVMGQTLATNLSNYEKARASMTDLQSELQQFYQNGGNTNIFSGSYENALAKVGEVSSPALRSLATQIEATLQIYRNAVSGTAYSVQEGQAIASIFPGINKTEGLNNAIIDGRMRAFDSVINSAYDGVLGDGVYQQLRGAYGGGSSSGFTSSVSKLPPGSTVTKGGITYKVGADGETLTQVTGDINFGAINMNSGFDFSKVF